MFRDLDDREMFHKENEEMMRTLDQLQQRSDHLDASIKKMTRIFYWGLAPNPECEEIECNSSFWTESEMGGVLCKYCGHVGKQYSIKLKEKE